MLLLVGQNILHPVNHTSTDFQEDRSPANRSPALQGALRDIPSLGQLLLIDVVTDEFGVVHGFAPLRCFRHERFLLRRYQVNSAVGGCLIPVSSV